MHVSIKAYYKLGILYIICNKIHALPLKSLLFNLSLCLGNLLTYISFSTSLHLNFLVSSADNNRIYLVGLT